MFYFGNRKPVYVIGTELCTWKFADFQKSLRERGVVRPFTGKEDVSCQFSAEMLCFTSVLLHTLFIQKLVCVKRIISQQLF